MREGKPNMGFADVITGLAESDNDERKSGSADVKGCNAGVPERVVGDAGVAERERDGICEFVFRRRMAGGCWSRRTEHDKAKA